MLVNQIGDFVKLEESLLNFNSFTEIARHDIGVHILSIEFKSTHLGHNFWIQLICLLAIVQLKEGGDHLLPKAFVFSCDFVGKMQSKLLNSWIRGPENL